MADKMSSIAASKMRAAMSEAKVTRETMAADIGMSEAKTSRLLSGMNSWSLADLEAVSDRLGIPTSVLISDEQRSSM